MGKKTRKDDLPAELAEFDSMGNPGQQSQDARAIEIHDNKKTGNIKDWLKTIELTQYADAFEKHHITQDELGSLEDNHLREIGVESVGHRIKMIQGMQEVVTKQHIEQGSKVVWEGEDITNNCPAPLCCLPSGFPCCCCTPKMHYKLTPNLFRRMKTTCGDLHVDNIRMEQITDVDTGEVCMCCENRGYLCINTMIDGSDSTRLRLYFPAGTGTGEHMHVCRAMEATKAAHMATFGMTAKSGKAMKAPGSK